MSCYPTANKMAFTTRLSIKLSLLLCGLVLLFSASVVRAEKISSARAQAVVTRSGQLAISTRFHIQLPDQLKQALQQGVPLYFDLSYQLTAPTLAAYRSRFNNLVGRDNAIRYRLSYHPLTGRYRVNMGTFSTEYHSLESALRAIGAAANWRVLSAGSLNDAQAVRADVRLNLSTSQLPKPFQINALTSKSWQLDSGWSALDVSAE